MTLQVAHKQPGSLNAHLVATKQPGLSIKSSLIFVHIIESKTPPTCSDAIQGRFFVLILSVSLKPVRLFDHLLLTRGC